MHSTQKYYRFIPSIKSHQLYSLFRRHIIHQPAAVQLKINKIMEYDWGYSTNKCIIYQLIQQQHTKYAELWMGTHKNGPSMLDDHISLQKYLQQLGLKQLPFLFKILCIEKALSIQLHPNKLQAQKLHAEKPQIYDNNEKPQMFYTLSQFQCFFGIINQNDLNKLFTISPFNKLHSKESQGVKQIIRQLISIKQEDKISFIEEIIANIGTVFPQRSLIVAKLQQQFPYDIGIAVSCLLNYKILPPGQCYAIAAGVPHAYVSGTCLQIMKNSDNVVRIGLTPKLKDVSTMLEIINDKKGLQGIKVQNTKDGYNWNNLVIIKVKCKGQNILCLKHLSIGIILQGKCEILQLNFKYEKGKIFLMHPGQYTLKGQCNIFFGSYSIES